MDQSVYVLASFIVFHQLTTVCSWNMLWTKEENKEP
jgi:hypothetical protein